MYTNLKPNQHRRISFNTTTMTSMGFIGPPKTLGPPLNLALPSPNLIFCSSPPPPNFFGLKFLGPPPKIGEGGGVATMHKCNLHYAAMFHKNTKISISRERKFFSSNKKFINYTSNAAL